MQIPVVNEQDEIIGYKDRKDRTPTDIIRVSAIWITDENGNILLQQRKLTKKENPGKWGPAVAGTVEEGETYEGNAYKEMEEEIGIKGVLLKPYKKLYAQTNVGCRFAQVYLAQIPHDTSLKPQEEEVEALKWISRADLQKSIEENPNNYVGAMKELEGDLF